MCAVYFRFTFFFFFGIDRNEKCFVCKLIFFNLFFFFRFVFKPAAFKVKAFTSSSREKDDKI